ncbi:spore coat protein YutH [Clostridium sp. CAG:1193]|nr:spore coat protein YutH [Clostridium sp. CAG:1193]
MNNYIDYYYNLYPNTIEKVGRNYRFFLNNEKYYIIMYERNLEEMDTLVKLNKEMIERGSLVHEIVLTKDGKAVFLCDNNSYALLRVYINENIPIKIEDIFYMLDYNDTIKPNNIIGRMNWANLWSSKVDYFEYHIGHLIKKYPYIYKTIDYYLGLAENAISYVKDIKTPASLISICHRRIGVTSTLFDLYNPFNLVIDYKVRDIAEYIKSVFFYGENSCVEGVVNSENMIVDKCNIILERIFKKYIFDNEALKLLFARLLFPSYYFDLYENVIDNSLNENVISCIIKKSSAYEEFLKIILLKTPIPYVEWLASK